MRSGQVALSLSLIAFGSLVWLPSCRDNAPPSDAAAPTASAGPEKVGGTLILATTTSTQDSGLLDVLVPEFERRTGVKVNVIAVGTGAALAMAGKGDADAVLTHAPSSEQRYVESGDLAGGKLVMHNDFVLVGPAADPAGVRGIGGIDAAMKAIAERGVFVSRGDDSGTHKKELELWKAAGIDLKKIAKREETGQGMGATLGVADEHGAYTLTDRGTYLALRRKLKLAVLFEGDRALLNVYHAYLVSPSKHPRVKSANAGAFVDFLVDPEIQKRIADFGKADFGEPLFIADAGKAGADLAKPTPSSSASAPPMTAPSAASSAAPNASALRPSL